MSPNLLGLFSFLMLFQYSVQYRCYSCGLISNAKPAPDDPPECGSQLKDDLLFDCPGDCLKVVFKAIDGSTKETRTCNAEDACKLLKPIAILTGSTVDCYRCSKDKCNSAMNIVASSSLLTILLSFVAYAYLPDKVQ